MYDPTRYKVVEKAIPSDRAWFDGRLLTAATQIVPINVTVLANTPTLVAKPDPQRIFIGMFPPMAGLAQVNVAPWSDVDQYFMRSLTNTSPFYITLFDSCGLVTAGWYATCSANVTLRVLQVRRA